MLNELTDAPALAANEAKITACVHCGLCLEACPTYVLTGDENDSPRGRIYLMRAVEEGRLQLDSLSFRTHMSRCLGCRACESACPAGVEYGHLLEAARDDIARISRPRGIVSRALNFALRRVWPHPKRLGAAFNLAKLFRNSGLPGLLRRTKLTKLFPRRLAFSLTLLEASAPAPISSLRANRLELKISDELSHASSGVETKSPCEDSARKVLLFKGCVTEGLFERVNAATARVLEANGCSASAPVAQVCCGALHAHAGDMEGARRFARRNIEAFEAEGDAHIITNTGGCGAMLVSYSNLFDEDDSIMERARSFSARVRDVSQMLEATGIIRACAPISDAPVTYDASCHLMHGQRAIDAPLKMLASNEALRFAPLEGSDVCCGGAGVYNLLEVEMSARILEEKLARIRETGAEILATGNPGCHMQIGAGALLSGMNLRVCHPVELLDEAYKRAGVYEGR